MRRSISVGVFPVFPGDNALSMCKVAMFSFLFLWRSAARQATSIQICQIYPSGVSLRGRPRAGLLILFHPWAGPPILLYPWAGLPILLYPWAGLPILFHPWLRDQRGPLTERS